VQQAVGELDGTPSQVLPVDSRAVAKQRIGVFGGTFDPPHNGHLVVAVNVLRALELDRLLLVVAGVPWQKVDARPVSPAADRLAMTTAMVDGITGLEASDIEVRRPGSSFTADTLAELAAPDVELFLVLGHDAAAGLDTWERIEEVRRLAVPVLVDRPGVPDPPLPSGWGWHRVEVPRLDISSSEVRDRAEDGRPLEGLVPAAVLGRLDGRGLYRGPT
jgi:nicotinate-nucleotide adenylyltransferase